MFFTPSKSWQGTRIWNMGISKTSDHIQIKIKMPKPSQEPPVSSKVPNEDLKDMDVLCTFKIKIESQNLDHGHIKDQWLYPSQDQGAKPQSVTSSILQSPKLGLKGHGCSFHLQNQDREQTLPKIWLIVWPNFTGLSFSLVYIGNRIEKTVISELYWTI